MNNTRTFYHVLTNTLITNITNMTVWFALTYFVYLQTESVSATGIIAGIYLIVTAGSGFWLGSIVDHYKKKLSMQLSGVVSLLFYITASAVFITTPSDVFTNAISIQLWLMVVLLLLGVIAGNIRSIALPTLVTLLIPEDTRDKANGLVGATTGAAFLVVSVISGAMMGFIGFWSVLVLAIVGTIAVMAHLAFVTIPEKGVVHAVGVETKPKKVDIKGTLKVILAIPGLFALILFTTFNNFLGGVFMALMDPYGLSMMNVQEWGILWGVLSSAFIFGGLAVSKFGLGKSPLRTMFLANIIIWVVSSIFTIQASVLLLSVGMFIYLLLVPAIEAAEQTILQKVVPPERQGRVFGFAQSIEQAASPLTAFAIGPITQLLFIPFMTTGAGVDLIGSWFGVGSARGIALVFVITGLVGLMVTLIAMATKYYRMLSDYYQKG